MKTVYLLGRWTEPNWEVMGIFEELQKALDNLIDGYWVVELPFNELYSEDKMLLVSYQIVDNKICIVAEDGTIIREL